MSPLVLTASANSIPRGLPFRPNSTGFTGGGMIRPKAIAIDGSEHVWVGAAGSPGTSTNSGSVSLFLQNGTPFIGNALTGGGINNPVALAIDASNDCWIVNGNGNSLSELQSGGTPISTATGYTGGGLNTPAGISIDGAGQCLGSKPCGRLGG